MTPVRASQLAIFRRIKGKFGVPKTHPRDRWRSMSNDDIWLRVVSQVVVVGKAAPADRLEEKEIRDRIRWNRLKMLSRSEAAKSLWMVMREIGTRYCSSDRRKCRKTNALMRNLDTLRQYPNGPKGFLKHVASLDRCKDATCGCCGVEGRIAFLMNNMSYFGPKSARDFLMSGFGLVRHHIALDVRILNVLKEVGIKIPKNVQTNAAIYRQFEEYLLRNVCLPLGISGEQFDQLIFRNSQQIMPMLGKA